MYDIGHKQVTYIWSLADELFLREMLDLRKWRMVKGLFCLGQTGQAAECENCLLKPFPPLRRRLARFPMAVHSKHEVLIVEDHDGVRESLELLLKSAGYTVSTAIHGFDALLQLKKHLPDVVLSDLNMPQMSGFELLSVVRRRFPQISVIAMSVAYYSGDSVPSGVIADAFYSKDQGDPKTLLRTVAYLIRSSAAHAVDHTRESAPVWIPRNGKDSHGIPYVVVTCTECLRSFPLSVMAEGLQTIQETPCLSCPNTVRYIIDFSLSVAAPRPEVRARTVIRNARQATAD
jgi:CheY-like chemotaxis protein